MKIRNRKAAIIQNTNAVGDKRNENVQ